MTISDQDYFEILTELGYPALTEDDLEFGRDDIENYFIYPALREYFIWFPIIETQSVYVSSDFSIDFPDEDTYGISSARVNSSVSGNGRTSSPFMNSLLYTKACSGANMYNTGNDYGVRNAMIVESSFNRSMLNVSMVKRLHVDSANRKLTGYSTVDGELIVNWAKSSTNFNDVPFIRKSDVINLAKSRVLKGFALLRSQLNSDVGVEFNSSDFMSRSEDLEEKVMTKWKSISKVTIIRS